MIEIISDCDVWARCPQDWLWIYDKLIVARRQGLRCGPAGVSPPEPAWYVSRPITNIRMMGRGAQRLWLTPDDEHLVPDGHFWCEWLSGPHASVDYHWGQPQLTVLGFRDGERLDRFCLWRRVAHFLPLPAWLHSLATTQEWINVEYIGDRVIEIHLRYNDDFRNHDSDEIIPVWQGQDATPPSGYGWYASAAGERLGFWTRHK